MDYGKLFQVLVIGGALLGTGCTEDEPSPPDDSAVPGDAEGPAADSAVPDTDSAVAMADASPGVDAAPGADAAPGTDAALEECGICPNEECCVTDESGASRERDGMVCCWGTSC